ncbi:MMPL family transporter [Arthrobacter sp. MSA 4-2]|uniref:MMPL family transporter n=1 Tax=Arthrobacter sp. MSA 4-2 TaxID=2794349 RepID=UPI0018E8DA6E|nr:MMPL family transporter [Arthrobacter sp. MSA 4-2]MBJ2120060.1 MMPL family transporter [Arthrobacter sp. MSA 4-2]
MAFLLYRLGKFAYRRRWWVVSAWLTVMVAVGASAVFFSGTLTNNFSIPGTESQRVADQLRRELPEAVGGTGTVVFRTDDGAAFTPDQESAVREALAGVAGLDGVRSVVDPFAVTEQLEGGRAELESGRADLASGEEQLEAGRAGLEQGQQELDAQRDQLEHSAPSLPGPALDAARAQLAAGQERLDAGRAELEGSAAELEQGRTELELAERRLEASSGVRLVADDRSAAVASVQFEKSINAVSPELREAVQEEAAAAAGGGVTVDYSKDIVEDVSEIFGYAEIIGLLVAALVLVLMLGTLVAAGLPLLMAVIGVGVGVGITFALSGIIEMNSISPVLALMLGLAVGIDYSLFIVNRHRTQLLHGMGLEESVGRATGTAGNAVLFAGLTVVVALAALAVPGLPFLTVMGLSAAGTVAVSVLVALTLTPALLAVLGTRLISARAWARNASRSGGASSEEEQRTQDRRAERGRGWGGFVTRRPALTLVAGILLLGAIAVPAAQLRVGLPDGGSEPADSTAFQAYSTVDEKFGEGANGPLIVVGAMPATAGEAELAELQLDVNDLLADIPEVAASIPASVSADGRTAVFQVLPEEGPASESTEDLVRTLRASSDDIEDRTGVSVSVTGQTAANIDVSARLMEAMPLYLGIVVGLSLILLLLVFRSVLVPLIATAGFLLSLLASFGATVAIYQWGWFGDLFGVTNPGPILSFLPIILIGVLFGLAMDYQMFLVSGMREAYVHGGGARAAVRVGFSHGARVVTAAAIIMVSVFAGFVFSHLTMVRPIGFGLAFGVLLDAFVVRMTLVPAAMYLLGRKAWWLPRWLDKILPDVDVEGAKLTPRPEPQREAVPAAG